LGPDPGLTFGRAVSDWLDHVENVEQRRKSTVRDYKGEANRMLLAAFGKDTPLAEITYHVIEARRSEWLRATKDDRTARYSKRTVQKALVLLGGVFKTAMRRHGFPANPSALVSKGTAPKSEVAYFTHAEVASIAEHAEAQDADLFVVMCRIGLRRGEMVALRWQDVDFDGEQVHVRRNYVEGIETTPKDHEVRDVPMQKDAQHVLARLSLRESFTDPDDLASLARTDAPEPRQPLQALHGGEGIGRPGGSPGLA
jgi:integrase